MKNREKMQNADIRLSNHLHKSSVGTGTQKPASMVDNASGMSNDRQASFTQLLPVIDQQMMIYNI